MRKLPIELNLSNQLCKKLEVVFFVFFLGFSHIIAAAIVTPIVVLLWLNLEYFIEGPRPYRRPRVILPIGHLFVEISSQMFVVPHRGFVFVGGCGFNFGKVTLHVVLPSVVSWVRSDRGLASPVVWSDRQLVFSCFERRSLGSDGRDWSLVQ